MIAHRLLQADEVDVEAPDRIDGPLEIVVSLPIRSLVDVEGGDAKGPDDVWRGRGVVPEGASQAHHDDNERDTDGAHDSHVVRPN